MTGRTRGAKCAQGRTWEGQKVPAKIGDRTGTSVLFRKPVSQSQARLHIDLVVHGKIPSEWVIDQ